MLRFQRWQELLQYTGPVYNELVLIFYLNWNPSSHSSYVKGVHINLRHPNFDNSPSALLGHILGIPDPEDDDSEEEEYEEGDCLFNHLSTGHRYTPLHKTMRVKDLRIDLKVLRKVLEHQILPKHGGTETITIPEAKILWRIAHFKRVSLPRLILSGFQPAHARLDYLAPYGMWLTRVFAYFGVDVVDEAELRVAEREMDHIGSTMLKRMHITVQEYRSEQTILAMESESDSSSGSEEEETEEEGEEQRQTGSPPTETGVPPSSHPSPSSHPPSSAPPPPSSPPSQPRSSAFQSLASRVQTLEVSIQTLSSQFHQFHSLHQQHHAQFNLDMDSLFSHLQIPRPRAPPTPFDPTFSFEDLTRDPTPPRQGE